MKDHIIDVKRQINASEYISPSRLRLWLKCPLAYKLRYIDGHERPPSYSTTSIAGKLAKDNAEEFIGNAAIDATFRVCRCRHFR